MIELRELWSTAEAALADYRQHAERLEALGEPFAISTDYVLTRSDLEGLLVGPVDCGSEHEGRVTITLHPEARLLVDLVVHAELTDPRGVMDARLHRLRVAVGKLLSTHFDSGFRAVVSKEAIDELYDVFRRVFAGP